MLTRVSQQSLPPLELADMSLTYSVFSRCSFSGYFHITDLHLLTELVHSEGKSVSKRLIIILFFQMRLTPLFLLLSVICVYVAYQDTLRNHDLSLQSKRHQICIWNSANHLLNMTCIMLSSQMRLKHCRSRGLESLFILQLNLLYIVRFLYVFVDIKSKYSHDLGMENVSYNHHWEIHKMHESCLCLNNIYQSTQPWGF